MLVSTDIDGDVLCAPQYSTQPTSMTRTQEQRVDPKKELVALLPQLLVHASRLTRSRQTADDLVQATCERTLSRLDQWQGLSTFQTWVIRIMESIWFNELRKTRQRREEQLEEPEEVLSSGFESSSNARFLLSELQERDLVSKEDFSFIMKIHLYGYTYRELAEECGIPINTLLSRVRRSTQKLRQAMLQSDQEQTV